MKIHGELSVGKKKYHKGDDLPAKFVYPFFLLHMGLFGLSGFLMAYASNGPGLGFLYAHGGLAILAYLLFYLTIFGLDEVRPGSAWRCGGGGRRQRRGTALARVRRRGVGHLGLRIVR